MSKQEKKGLVPVLRFPEFRDRGEWEEKLLQDISPAIFDGTHQTPKYTDEGIPFYSVENIVSGNKNKFISKEDHKIATRINKPEKDDILITRIGSMGFSAIVTWDFEFSIYVTLAVVKKSKRFNSQYLHGYFQSPRYQTEIHKKSLLNAVPCKINMDELRKTEVLLPEPDEQQKIADCLTSVDELITAQTQKLDGLKAHKKGLMQQLFPAEGETVPKLRFPEFRDKGAWVPLSLEALLEKVIDNRGKTPPLSDSGFPLVEVNALGDKSIDYGQIRKYVDEETYKNWFRGHVREGDILFSTVGAIAECSLVCKRNTPVIAQNIVGLRFNVSTIPEFALYLLTTTHNKNQFLRITMGAVQPSLKVSQMIHLSFYVPKPDEQQKIADCLSSIDKLITAQTQKIDALKTHKKGLMQQLFPVVEARE